MAVKSGCRFFPYKSHTIDNNTNTPPSPTTTTLHTHHLLLLPHSLSTHTTQFSHNGYYCNSPVNDSIKNTSLPYYSSYNLISPPTTLTFVLHTSFFLEDVFSLIQLIINTVPLAWLLHENCTQVCVCASF